ncbi:MAG: MFS transporter [Alphaproteobacteria bacterium]|nr:MFS transporter [Alphaproteobacteria bacterium]
MTNRRFWVYFLLFLFNVIAYTDRVNISVAGKPIADELGLSPIALGYLFSSFLWAYVVMMLPGGRLIDRFGPHNVAAIGTTIWSIAQMLTGAAGSFLTMLLTRLGLGIGEAPYAPVTYRSVGLWGPITERGTAIATISAGSSLGAAIGAPFVAWIISISSWRWSFVVTGALGLVWVAIWRLLVSTPEKTSWIPEPERRRILKERDGGLEAPDHGGVGYLGLARAPAMWGLFISQGCMVYTVYLYLSWLPNYLQTQRHMTIMGSGIYTALPFLIASAVNIIANWLGDRAMSIEAVHAGKRRYLVAICLVMTASGMLIPYVESLTAMIVLVTFAVSFANVGPATNGALTNDLLRSPSDAGRALAFLVLGGNTFGLCAPIVTGYLVDITGSFNSAFIAAGALALIGAVAALTLSRGTLGEVAAPRLEQPRLVS